MSDDLKQRYRELPREEPPRSLDEAILAASRRAVHRRRRWYVPVAAAAVIVLSVAVVVHMDRERPDAELVTPNARVLETPAPPPRSEENRQQPARPAAKPSRQEFAAEPRADSAGARASAPAARAPASQGAPASVLARVAPSPEQWLQGIADLRRQGRDEEADRELAQFRKQYPDYRLSDEMKAKVEKRQ